MVCNKLPRGAAVAALPALFLGYFAAAATVSAQTSYPMLMSVHPVAARVGETSEHTIKSRYSMYGASQVLVTGEGVTGEIVPHEAEGGDAQKKPNLQALKVRFTVAPDALPGVRDFRIATPQGASTVGQLVIARDPVVSEQKDNDTPEKAQTVSVPATICGTIEKGEDVDYYRFHAAAGASLSFHVRAMRLQNRIHDLQQHVDPILTLRNEAGVTLAASDNFYYGDPFIAHAFEQEGDYLLEIRDVRYQGNQYWEYSIEVSDQPYLSHVYPLAVAPGSTSELETVGFHLPEPSRVTLNLPDDVPLGPQTRQLPLGEGLSNPVPLVVSELPLVGESQMENDTAEQAELVTAPCGINGRIESEGDIDCFAFEAKKGDKLSFEVVARRRQSNLDSHLRILDSQGKQLALNDDLRLGKRSHADSWIENWTAPADGRYVVEIRDLHLRGGAPFVYYLEITESKPYFELYTDTDKTQLTPGTGGIIFVRAERKNGFDGEIQLEIEGLPPGVSASCGRILAGKGQDGCIVLQAENDAEFAVNNVVIRGTAQLATEEGSEQTLTAEATVYQETYQPGGGRGHWPVVMHTVSVAAPSDVVDVRLSTYEITLKPGETQRIDVTIERSEEYDKNVTLDVLYKHLNSVYGDSLPEGVTLDGPNSKTLLTGGATEGYITLKAADNAAPVEKQQFAVMANVSLNFVMKATYASKPVFVTIEKKE